MIRFHNLTKEEVLAHFGVGYDGLTPQQAVENQKKYGQNVIREQEAKSRARVFFEQFKDLLVIILICAAILSLFTGEIASTIVIFVVIILNAAIGTYQHVKAEKSLQSLRRLSAPVARVVRAGKEYIIPSLEITPGDIVVVRAGDVICADGRVLYAEALEVNESSLTGEALAVEKNDARINKGDTPLGDQKNMLFSGSLVTAGKGLMVVTAVGMETELGKIAGCLRARKGIRRRSGSWTNSAAVWPSGSSSSARPSSCSRCIGAWRSSCLVSRSPRRRRDTRALVRSSRSCLRRHAEDGGRKRHRQELRAVEDWDA